MTDLHHYPFVFSSNFSEAQFNLEIHFKFGQIIVSNSKHVKNKEVAFMFKYADPILSEFDNCFSYRATYYWFVVIISGFIIRFDHNGVSSFVRYLFLEPKQYDLLLHFFRTDSW